MNIGKKFTFKNLTPEAIEQMQPAELQAAKSYFKLMKFAGSILILMTLTLALFVSFLFDVEELGKSILFAVFAVGLFIVSIIVKSKINKIYKNIKTVYDGKELTKFQKTEGRITVLIYSVISIIIFALIISFATGLTSGSKSGGNECTSCGKSYSSGSPLDGYCNNCYQKVKNIYDIYEG